ncbi:MAG TPA: NAD(P)H-dependent glycerol-3-phosphate dehydrogenase [Beijerinckiaceae bacterium]|nr:NAD(P)H-dependent glycerol-3-phosphate dehydrogenase [Beijerinckiaceae bacterium]
MVGGPIAVLGAGSWGTALANVGARGGNAVKLWARDAAAAAAMAADRENRRRLPGVQIEGAVVVQSDLAAAVAGAIAILVVVPAQAVRGLCEALTDLVPAGVPIIVCAKGIERTSGLLMSEIVETVLPARPPAILSGPSFAGDVSRGLPTAVTLAAREDSRAAGLAAMLSAPSFRVYHSTDMRGVEIGGAAKNVLAIACGIAAGRGLGASCGAALVARGFAELARFGRACGAEAETLTGLSGLGDLVLTCNSTQSRNYSFGLAIGRGESFERAAQGKVVEGIYTAAILVEKAAALGVDMPIAASVDAILCGRLSVDDAIEALLARPQKAEGR